ncbi:hypothetical protein DYL59_04770 [Pseudomonas kairouanensis]|uniref:Uncharacterized protein n=1 Tax=Pseudomonas kairouanensis TaxID=2293832 RepID=A0A4Z0AZK9_9PSED|nr:hypothetical protein DYL59_04770 [Pseudomonas kairouanensis]
MQIVVPRTCYQSCTTEPKRESCQVAGMPGLSAGHPRRDVEEEGRVHHAGAPMHCNEALTAGTCSPAH